MNIAIIKADLTARGFVEGNNGKMEYACGSIAHYKKCTVYLGHGSHIYGDLVNQWFYSVRFESFAESGQPEFDHHTIMEQYIAESSIPAFLREHGILSKAELEDIRAERNARLAELRKRKEMRG